MRWYLSGSTWRVAEAVATLARQLDAIWPTRHGADGTVGDLSHQARRSDHNPNANGVVTAIDVGIVGDQGKRLVAAVVAGRDRRVKYMIHDRTIWRNYDKPGIPAWSPAPYTGSNAHTTHVHISVSADPILYDDPKRWNLGELDVVPTPEPEPTEDEILTKLPTLKERDGFRDGRPELRDDVRRLQALLAIAGVVASDTFGDDHRPDGLFGPGTLAAVRTFQGKVGISVDGIAGPDTWSYLLGVA